MSRSMLCLQVPWRTFIFSMIWLLAVTNASGQGNPRILRFDSPVMEIDTVRYDGGPVTVRFECTNISDRKVSIVDVHSQCGCAKPSFSREPIAPGAKGYVDVVLDPSHLFAEQTRHLTVIATNGDYRKFNTITVHGYVERDVTEEAVLYPHELLPGLRSDMIAVGMRLYRRGEVSVKEFTIYNSGSEPFRLGWKSDFKNVKAELPGLLEPGASAKVRVSVSTAGMPSGDYQETFRIIANGVTSKDILLKGAVK